MCPDRGAVVASQVARIATAARQPATATRRGFAQLDPSDMTRVRLAARGQSPVLAANLGLAPLRPRGKVPEAVSERIFHLRQGRPPPGQRFLSAPRIG
jgi:hypothetical protein